MWRSTLKALLAGTTIYYKKVNLFLAILLIGGGFLVIKDQYFNPNKAPQAASELPQALVPHTETDEATYQITVEKSGKILVNDREIKGALQFEPDKDRFLLVLVRENPTYINTINAIVTLPYPIDNSDSFNPRIFAIHNVGPSFYRVIDAQTIAFEAHEVDEGATVSIRLDFPKSYLDLSPINQIRDRIATLPPAVWLVIAITLPSLALGFLLYLLLMRAAASRRIQNRKVITAPPASISPAIIGTLYRGQIGKKEITATLFDLALRGFISIHYGDEDEVAFSKGSSLFNQQASTLRPFEIFLLHQIFGDGEFISTNRNVEVGLNSELFSSKIALTMLNIYDAALADGYFIQSPNKYYLKYKIIGILLFFIALAALLYGAFVLPARGYILFFWVGMLGTSLMIIGITPGLPRRTKQGDKTLKEWIAFRNYLTLKEPVSGVDTNQFFSYLPYAIVLNCEKEWISRWSTTQALRLPNWFSANINLYTAEDYSRSLVSVINFLARHLLSSRPPDLA